jgi:hypothetical protein
MFCTLTYAKNVIAWPPASYASGYIGTYFHNVTANSVKANIITRKKSNKLFELLYSRQERVDRMSAMSEGMRYYGTSLLSKII